MTKKRIEIFLDIQNEYEFNYILQKNDNKLICAEIYSSMFGSCTALDRLFQIIKLDWSENRIVLLKVNCDGIKSLKRFWNQSEPVYMFIVSQKVTTIFRGVNQIKFGEIAKMEIQYFNKNYERLMYDIDEITPGEKEYYDIIEEEHRNKIKDLERERMERQAARKKHRAKLLAPHLKHLNFVLFWPHMKRAHPELYQRWDDNNIIMVGREEIQLSKELAMDILYEGDAPINEASLHCLLAAPALVICFRLLDTDKHFITLVRKILYEDIITSEDKPNNKTAFEQYLTYSLSANVIRKKRKEEKEIIKAEELYKRARRLSEMRRLALQAKEEAIKERKLQKEQMRINALKSGNLTLLENTENDDEDVEDISLPEELPDEVPEESSSSEDENEYFPPEGLIVPGFYSPPNDIAKANGLPLLFPKIVSDYVVPPPELLPEHVLVLLNIAKRYKAIKVLKPYYKRYILHLGIFKVTPTLDKIKHVAYSVKQFDTMFIPQDINIKLAIMISTKIDLPLLELVDLVPDHISRDNVLGEIECSRFFPVNYSDEGIDFEDFY